MDANELIEEFLAECVDLVITDYPQSTIIIIPDTKMDTPLVLKMNGNIL